MNDLVVINTNMFKRFATTTKHLQILNVESQEELIMG
jgi:hypothetical protein